MQSLAKVTTHAARILGVNAGTLKPGADADICLYDPKSPWIVKASALASQGKHPPFLGYELAGQVKATIVAGHVAFER